MANAMDVYPPRDLPGRADDWGRRVEGVAEDLYKAQVQLRQTVNNGQRATAGQLALLSRQIDRISESQEDLRDASMFYEASVGTTWNGVTSWVTGQPSITAQSRSGRFRVSVYGGAASGMGIFTFSAPGYNRERAKGGTAGANLSRVSALGGASVAGSAFRSWVISLSPNTPHLFTAEGWCDNTYTSIIGMGISVEPML